MRLCLFLVTCFVVVVSSQDATTLAPGVLPKNPYGGFKFDFNLFYGPKTSPKSRVRTTTPSTTTTTTERLPFNQGPNVINIPKDGGPDVQPPIIFIEPTTTERVTTSAPTTTRRQFFMTRATTRPTTRQTRQPPPTPTATTTTSTTTRPTTTTTTTTTEAPTTKRPEPVIVDTPRPTLPPLPTFTFRPRIVTVPTTTRTTTEAPVDSTVHYVPPVIIQRPTPTETPELPEEEEQPSGPGIFIPPSPVEPLPAVQESLDCNGEWASENGAYTAKWMYVGNGQVRFTISVLTDPNRWVAIGFSRNMHMAMSDIAYGWVDPSGTTGRLFDAWASGRRQPSAIEKQDLEIEMAESQDSRQIIQFTKPVYATEATDLTLENVHLLFPVRPGVYDAVSETIGYHEDTPIIGPKVSFTNCPEPPLKITEESSPSQPIDQELCFCTREYEPVCANDGAMYPNFCEFECSQKNNPTLLMVDCPQQTTEAVDACFCTREYNPVCANDGMMYGNPCEFECAQRTNLLLRIVDCPRETTEATVVETTQAQIIEPQRCACTREYNPVCASDGNMYPNPCEFDCARRIDLTLRIVACPQETTQVPSPQPLEPERCACTREYNPVCASDGNMYPNRCEFDCARRIDLTLRIVDCPQETTQAPSPQPLEPDGCFCTREYNPVCASDGNMYPNPCEFDCARRTDLTLRIVDCPQETTQAPSPQPLEPDGCFCTREYNPVCASDGNMYPNPCEFDCAQRIDLTLRIVDCPQETTQAPRPQPLEPDGCFCTREYNPVCASDGNMYPNPCEFDCARRTNPSLLSIDCPDQNLCICTDEYDPVCGNDGMTYGNPCELQCETRNNPSLVIAYLGECREDPNLCICTQEYNPICGDDGKTYGNPCELQCEVKKSPNLAIAYLGECREEPQVIQEECICTKEYNPVCGSDGKTYSNPCIFNCAARKDPDLFISKNSDCKSPDVLDAGRALRPPFQIPDESRPDHGAFEPYPKPSTGTPTNPYEKYFDREQTTRPKPPTRGPQPDVPPQQISGIPPQTVSANVGTQTAAGRGEQGRRFIRPLAERNTEYYPLEMDGANVEDVQVMCDMNRNAMRVTIRFDRRFDGLIFTKNYFKADQCRTIGTGRQSLLFEIPLDGCGTEGTRSTTEFGGTAVFTNTIVVMTAPELGILEAWDRAYRVSCDFGRDQQEGVDWGVSVPPLQSTLVEGGMPAPDCTFRVVRGPAVGGPGIERLVLGDVGTLIWEIRTNGAFDIIATSCTAHDGMGMGSVDLIDENGCPLHSKFIQAVQKERTDLGTRLAANFKVFKFPDVPDVYFDCQCNVCVDKCFEPVCDGRRRPVTHDPGQTFNPFTQSQTPPGLPIGKRKKRELTVTFSDKDVKSDQVFNSIRVFVPSEEAELKQELQKESPLQNKATVLTNSDVCLSKVSLAAGSSVILLIVFIAGILAALLIRQKRQQAYLKTHSTFLDAYSISQSPQDLPMSF